MAAFFFFHSLLEHYCNIQFIMSSAFWGRATLPQQTICLQTIWLICSCKSPLFWHLWHDSTAKKSTVPAIQRLLFKLQKSIFQISIISPDLNSCTTPHPILHLRLISGLFWVPYSLALLCMTLLTTVMSYVSRHPYSCSIPRCYCISVLKFSFSF